MRGKDKPHPDLPFQIRRAGDVWQVRHRKSWVKAKEVSILAPVIAASTGLLVGVGVVTRKGSRLIITA